MTAFAPANISLIFETYEASPPHDRGSLGVGITLEEGVTARISPARQPGIYVGEEQWEFPTVAEVLMALAPEPVRIHLSAAFPFGCGFGMSGASALASAFAIDSFFQLGKSREELGMVAHRAEVACATGLGDVGGQFNGGIMIKTRKHEPLVVDQLPLRAQRLHVLIHGPIRTSEVISSKEKLVAINAAGHEALEEIRRQGTGLTMQELFSISHDFARNAKLLTPKVEATIQEALQVDGCASMIMLGEAIVSTRPFPGSRTVRVRYTGAEVFS